jgi:hypothetical protein
MKLNPAAVGITRRDNVDFDADIRAAQAFRIDMSVDKLERINEYESDPLMASVISKNIQFVASKRYRQVYGDKLDVNHNHTINIRAAMDAARERTLIDISPNILIPNINATDTISVAQAPLFVVAGDVDPLS